MRKKVLRKFALTFNHLIMNWGLVTLGGTDRDDISVQFASRNFRPCRNYTWVAVMN